MPIATRHTRHSSVLVAAWVALVVAVSAIAADPAPSLAADPASPPPTPAPSTSPTPSAPASPAPSPSAVSTPSSPSIGPRAVAPVGTLAPAATPYPTPTAPTPIGSTVTFHGRGWGHGVGLSQYGARGRALAGQTSTQILDHYFQGTTTGTLPLDTAIRVRVLAGFTASPSSPLVLYGRGGSWTIDGVATVFPADAKVTVAPTIAGGTSWAVTVTAAGGTILHEGATTGLRMRPSGAATILQIWSRPSSYDEYRGVLRVRLDTTGPTLNVVNEVDLETYLRGVVPAEMPSSWPAAALEAQTLAARSYAARRLRPGTSYYDVTDDTNSQVYLGREGEKASTDAAILATAGIVRKSGASIANTMFSSTAGGATEHNENAFVSSSGAKVAGPVSYLRGRPDRDQGSVSYDASSPYATWTTATYTRDQLSGWFAADARTNVGALTAIDFRDRGVSGRLISVTLVGAAGTKTVSGDVFRSVFNAGRPSGDPSMRSTLVDVAPIP